MLNETLIEASNILTKYEGYKSRLSTLTVIDYIIIAIASIMGVILLWNLMKEGLKSVLLGLALVIVCIIAISLIIIL